MNKEAILNSITKVREVSKKRKFPQTFDLVINLKDINLKKPEENINIYVTLPFSTGKKVKICGLVGPELQISAKQLLDKTITNEEFPEYRDKKQIKILARQYDYFVAQADLMTKVASTFGKVLGPKQRMPDPKAGCVIPPTADLKPFVAKLAKQVRLQTKNEAIVKCAVGFEEMKDEEIESNITTVYQALIRNLKEEEKNVAKVYLKLTMGTPVEITDKGPIVKKKEVKEKKKKAKKIKEKKEQKKEEKAEAKESKK